MKIKPFKNNGSASFSPDSIFHVYNRTNNKELLFHDENDRWRFLFGYRKYLVPFVKTYCFCLLDNHFHFHLKVKSVEQILQACRFQQPYELTKIQKEYLKEVDNEGLVPGLMKMQFSRFFDSYSKYFNAKYRRNGNLFNRPFKRSEVEDAEYFKTLVCYIHTNPLKHYKMKLFRDYAWSSYQPILNQDVFIPIEYDELIATFGSKSAYLEAHIQWEKTLLAYEMVQVE